MLIRLSRSSTIQEIKLKPIQTDGLIIDIGGGGEGLVSRIGGVKVCALDIRMSEIREAQIHGPPSNWFVGDGQHLCFQDNTFDTATMWFSLGYMSDWDMKKNVLEEVYRVLVKGGRLSILASKIPKDYEHLIFWGNFTLPDGTVSQTGYGVKGDQGQTLDRIIQLLVPIGFRVSSQDNGAWFEIQATKI